MIKKLVFDVDDTLIMWKNEYLIALEKSLSYFKMDCSKENVIEINKMLDLYQYEFNIYTKEDLTNFINERLNINLPNDFIEYFLEQFGQCADEADIEMIETLEYLHNKYELVVLTNWFKNPQTNRLRKTGILKYFKEIHAGDEGYLKPCESSFIRATKNFKPHECIMIGDNINCDINGAIKYGMGAVLCDFRNKNSNSNEFVRIEKFKDLMNIL